MVDPEVGTGGIQGLVSASVFQDTAQSYVSLERDNKIRNALVQNKYARLKDANRQIKGVKLDKVGRRKYWGELRDGDS